MTMNRASPDRKSWCTRERIEAVESGRKLKGNSQPLPTKENSEVSYWKTQHSTKL